MKCEHEECENTAARIDAFVTGEIIEGYLARDLEPPPLCRAHLAAWFRAVADEVEGVKECPRCSGKATLECHTCGEYHECLTCDGTGKVPT